MFSFSCRVCSLIASVWSPLFKPTSLFFLNWSSWVWSWFLSINSFSTWSFRFWKKNSHNQNTWNFHITSISYSFPLSWSEWEGYQRLPVSLSRVSTHNNARPRHWELQSQWVGSFTTRRVVNVEELQDRAYGLSFLSKKPRCNHKGRTFILSYWKTLSVDPARVRTQDLLFNYLFIYLFSFARLSGRDATTA